MVFSIVVTVALIITGIILWYSGKKEVVLKVLYLLVHKAEVYFKAGENQAKIDFVLKKIKEVIPKPFRWLWSDEWIKKQVVIILLDVEKQLNYQSTIDTIVNEVTKDAAVNAQNYALDAVGTVTNYLTDRLLKADVNGNTNLVDNETIKLINADIHNKINNGLDLRAFAQAKTDFKGNSEAVAGIEVKKTF